jgi:exodeoxyribonuclease V gamma subunit
MADMFERYAKGLAEWPHEAPHDEPVSHTHAASGLTIDDWLRGLRLNEDEARGRVVLEPSDAVKKGKYQRHHLVKHWLAHLAGHLGGQPLTTLIVSKAGNVRFEPLDPDDARAQIDTLLAAWQDGMARPLPLAIKTAFAWLDGSASARSVYEGGYQLTGEVEASPYLRRAWPSFEALTASGEFARLAETLLRPLFTATFVESSRSRKAAAPAGDQA